MPPSRQFPVRILQKTNPPQQTRAMKTSEIRRILIFQPIHIQIKTRDPMIFILTRTRDPMIFIPTRTDDFFNKSDTKSDNFYTESDVTSDKFYTETDFDINYPSIDRNNHGQPLTDYYHEYHNRIDHRYRIKHHHKQLAFDEYAKYSLCFWTGNLFRSLYHQKKNS